MKLKAVRYIKTENGEKYRIVYTVIKERALVEEERKRLYGIRIDKYKGKKIEESAQFKNITSKSIEITRLFVLLSKHAVTPVALEDVLEDYLARI